jgi:hypothetical protein
MVLSTTLITGLAIAVIQLTTLSSDNEVIVIMPITSQRGAS